MRSQWIEKVTGAFEDKKRYRDYKNRKQKLPNNYRTAIDALERYLMYFGAISDGNMMLRMLDDLLDLFEQSATDGTPVREVVGDDPVEFAEIFLQNYSEGQWVQKERERLIRAVNQATGDDGEAEGRAD